MRPPTVPASIFAPQFPFLTQIPLCPLPKNMIPIHSSHALKKMHRNVHVRLYIHFDYFVLSTCTSSYFVLSMCTSSCQRSLAQKNWIFQFVNSKCIPSILDVVNIWIRPMVSRTCDTNASPCFCRSRSWFLSFSRNTEFVSIPTQIFPSSLALFLTFPSFPLIQPCLFSTLIILHSMNSWMAAHFLPRV